MAKYRLKPIDVEAYQWWKNGDAPSDSKIIEHGNCCTLESFDGTLRVNPGEWIVRYSPGVYDSLSDHGFHSKFEKAK